MKILQVDGLNNDFYQLCKKLENFQFQLMPQLKEKGYCLTDDLQSIEGFVLYENERAVGSIGLKQISNEICEIVRVFVCEECRGKGYATSLFDKIINHAKMLGYKRAEMSAWSKSKEALSLYKKLGFVCSEEKTSSWYSGLKYYDFYKDI